MYFLPPRILQITINTITPYANWTDGSMGSGDPWVGYPYQWTVDFTVNSQLHSSQLTPTPFYYTGTDIQVGDWLSDISQGLAVKIVQILSQSQSELTVIVEDVDRFNTFTDPTQSGNGIGSSTGTTASAYVFVLNDEGLPILSPMTGYAAALQTNVAFQQDQIGRFMYRNYMKSFYLVYQPGHTFSQGDILVLSQGVVANVVTGSYSLVTANTSSVKAIVGQVSSVGAPGPSYFAYRPVGRVVNTISPTLPGLPGDLIYLSANGMVNYDNVATHYSNVAPTAWATPIYIQLANTATGISLNRGVDTAGSLGYSSKSYVVADQNASNALQSSLNVGDFVHVDNSGYGEWTHYLSHNAGLLRQISTQDSAHVDAESLEVTITPTTALSNVIVNSVSMAAYFMGNVSATRSVTGVNVTVNQAFSSNAVITIGTNAVVDLIMTESLIDLTNLGAYAYQPTVTFTAPYTSVYAFVNLNGSLTGNASITVTYT